MATQTPHRHQAEELLSRTPSRQSAGMATSSQTPHRLTTDDVLTRTPSRHASGTVSASHTPRRQPREETLSRTPGRSKVSSVGSRTPHRYHTAETPMRTPSRVNEVTTMPYRTPQNHRLVKSPSSHSTLEKTPLNSMQRMSSLASFASLEQDQQQESSHPWTPRVWRQLEKWYDKMDRNVERASSAFYRHESIQTVPPTMGEREATELWSLNYIRWRCQCLDTNTKFYDGLLPSERHRKKRKQQFSQDRVDREPKLRR